MTTACREASMARWTTTRVWAAYVDGWLAGVLTADCKDDVIELVYVRDGERRKGVATALLAQARADTGLRLVTDRGDRSLMGSAWCRAQGIKVEPGRGYKRMAQREADGYGARLMIRLPVRLADLDEMQTEVAS